jgi:hypothetical protein
MAYDLLVENCIGNITIVDMAGVSKKGLDILGIVCKDEWIVNMDQPGNRLNAGKNDPNLTSEQIFVVVTTLVLLSCYFPREDRK